MVLEGMFGLEAVLIVLIVRLETLEGMALLWVLARDLQVFVDLGALGHFDRGRKKVSEVVGQEAATETGLR